MAALSSRCGHYIFALWFPDKDNWQNQIVHVPEDIVCFTDGSRLQSLSQAGASVHNRTTGLDKIMPLGKYCTVF